jgi:hypothetical protein
MYHHQAMREPDRNKFEEAMQKECTAHYKEGTYKLFKKNSMPSGVHYSPVYGKRKERENHQQERYASTRLDYM